MIHALPFYTYSRQWIVESFHTVRHRWLHALTPQQQAITFIALAALSCLVIGYVLSFCWRKDRVVKVGEDIQPEIAILSPSVAQKMTLEEEVSDSESDELSSDESPSSNDKRHSSHSPMNRYELDQILHTGEMLTVRAKAANVSLEDYVIAIVNKRSPPQTTGGRPAYRKKVEQAMSNFTRLFLLGKKLIQPFENNLISLDPRQENHQLSITSPKELVGANLSLHAMLEEVILEEINQRPQYANCCRQVQTQDFCEIDGISAKKIIEHLQRCQLIDQDRRLISDEPNQNAIDELEKCIRKPELCKKILEVLFCVAFRSKKEMIRLRLTRTTFLDPRILSDMSQNQLTIEEANLLLTCIGLKENKNEISICNLRTSEYPQEIIQKLRKQNSPPLCFMDPHTLQMDAQFTSKINEEEALKNRQILDQVTKALTALTYEKFMPLLPFLDPKFHDYLMQQLREGYIDHVVLREIVFDPERLEQFFKEALSVDKLELIDTCFEHIRIFLSCRLDELDKVLEKLPNHQSVMEDCLIIEAETRLKEAMAVKDQLSVKFQDFKHIIRQFLLFSTQTFELSKTYPYTIRWKMDDVEVKEVINLEKKSCALSRRIHFPAIGNQRSDLTYFSEEEGDSIAYRWETICKKYRLTDKRLAEKFFKLYIEGALDSDEEAEIKQFLAPLVVLLMGKEPALDRSSLAANFILLMSVKLGMCNFATALRSMPMIPQGAVSAKQFLLHITEHALDTISGVQYKNNKTILPSYFLPTLAAFVGTARNWTQKYDDVATIAVKCCQKLFVLPIQHSRSLFILVRDLNHLLGKKHKLWEISHALDYRKIEESKAAVKEICLKYIERLGKGSSLPNDETRSLAAVALCREDLISSKDLSDEKLQSLIRPLKDLFDVEDASAELVEMLDLNFADEIILEKQEIACEYLRSIGEPDDSETAVERCQVLLTPGIDRNDLNIQELKNLLEKVYEIPVPYSYVPVAIEYNTGLNDDEDEIGKWAIEYVFDLHPLIVHP